MLVHLFIAFTLLTWVWNNSMQVGLLDLSPAVQSFVRELNYTLMVQLGASFTVPVVIWVLVTFRRRDVA